MVHPVHRDRAWGTIYLCGISRRRGNSAAPPSSAEGVVRSAGAGQVRGENGAANDSETEPGAVSGGATMGSRRIAAALARLCGLVRGDLLQLAVGRASQPGHG